MYYSLSAKESITFLWAVKHFALLNYEHLIISPFFTHREWKKRKAFADCLFYRSLPLPKCAFSSLLVIFFSIKYNIFPSWQLLEKLYAFRTVVYYGWCIKNYISHLLSSWAPNNCLSNIKKRPVTALFIFLFPCCAQLLSESVLFPFYSLFFASSDL